MGDSSWNADGFLLKTSIFGQEFTRKLKKKFILAENNSKFALRALCKS